MNLLTNIDSQTFIKLLFLGLVILIIYRCCILTNQSKNQSKEQSKITDFQKNNWINEGFGYGYGEMNPADQLLKVIKEFGSPSFFNGESRGQAIWDKSVLKGTPFEKIEIRDQQIPHDKPMKHSDFLYSFYKIDIPEHLIGSLKKISESIFYNLNDKIMIARCYDIKANVVTHWIVKKYIEGQIEIDEAVGMYGPMILEIMQNDSTESKYRSLLADL